MTQRDEGIDNVFERTGARTLVDRATSHPAEAAKRLRDWTKRKASEETAGEVRDEQQQQPHRTSAEKNEAPCGMSKSYPAFIRQQDQSRVSAETPVTLQPARQVQECDDRTGQSTDWVASKLEQIPVWQETTHLVHLRWSITNRALATGGRQCRNTVGNIPIEGIRSGESGFKRSVLASLTPSRAEAEHAQAADMLARLTLYELIGVIEQIVIKSYRLFLFENPYLLSDCWENDGMKRLFSRRVEKPEAWQRSWSRHVDRALDEWRPQQTRALVLSYWQHAGLDMPKRGLCTTVEDLDTAIGFFMAIRDNMLERADTVGSGLARLSDLMGFEDFNYTKGSPLVVDGRQIELVEAFFHEYLEILRRALQERASD